MKKKLKNTSHLYNLNADPQMTYVLTHLVEKGEQYLVGKPGDKTHIVLAGAGIEEEHALIQSGGDNNVFIKIVDPDAKVRFNGQLLVPGDSMQLRHNDRLLFGTSHLYVFADPSQSGSSTASVSNVTYEMAQDEISACIGLSSAEEKSKDAAVIREALSELRPAVDEANSISEELDQKVKFDVLVVPPHYRGVDKGNTEIMVRMNHLENGMSWVWSREEFINRKFLMQELYEGTLPGTKPSQDNNPFVEDSSSDVLIGSSVVSPQCLAYMVDMRQQFPIVGYGGENLGVLNASLIPFDSKGNEISEENSIEFIDDPREMIGKTYKVKVKIENARGIPKRFKDIFVKYDMFLDVDNKTKVVSGTNNPDFSFTMSHRFKPVTAELISWLRKGNLIFQVWGKQQAVPAVGRRLLTTKQLSKTATLATAAAQLQQTQSKWKDLTTDKLTRGILHRRCENLERKLHLMRLMVNALEEKNVSMMKVAAVKKILSAQPDSDAFDQLIRKAIAESPNQGSDNRSSKACRLM